MNEQKRRVVGPLFLISDLSTLANFAVNAEQMLSERSISAIVLSIAFVFSKLIFLKGKKR